MNRESRLLLYQERRSEIYTAFNFGAIKTIEERDRRLREIEFLIAPQSAVPQHQVAARGSFPGRIRRKFRIVSLTLNIL